MDIAFQVRALYALSVLRDLEASYPNDQHIARMCIASRVAIYQAARVAEALGSGNVDVPFEERLRAFHDDPFGVRRWKVTDGNFFGGGVFVAHGARRFLIEARVAAVYGMLDAAMSMLDNSLVLSEKQRAEVFERLSRVAEAAREILEKDKRAAVEDKDEPAQLESDKSGVDAVVAAEVAPVVEEPAPPKPVEPDTTETLPAPAPDVEPSETVPEQAKVVAIESKRSRKKKTATG